MVSLFHSLSLSLSQSIHIHALGAQIGLGQLDLVHQFGVGLGGVAEGEEAET